MPPSHRRLLLLQRQARRVLLLFQPIQLHLDLCHQVYFRLADSQVSRSARRARAWLAQLADPHPRALSLLHRAQRQVGNARSSTCTSEEWQFCTSARL
jgi:hypothetical protein